MGRRGLTGDTPALAVAIAAILVAAGFGAYNLVRDQDQDRARRQYAEPAGRAHVAFAQAVTLSAQALEGAAASVDVPRAGVAVIRPMERGYALDASHPAFLTDADLSTPFLHQALDVARDGGEAAVTAGRVGPSRTPTALIVVASYAGGQVPATTAARRAAVTGFGVASLDVDALVERAFVSLDRSGVVVRDGGLVLATRGPSGSVGVQFGSSVAVGERMWAVSSATALPGTPGRAWAVLALALSLAGTVALAANRRNRMVREAEEEAQRRADENRLIAELGPVLQSSLELGEVLPAVTVSLADALGLSWVEIDVSSREGGLGGVFSYGRGRDGGGGPSQRPTDEFVLPLRRGGRSLGALRVGGRRPISGEQARALESIGDLVAGAVTNAGAFGAEQAAVERLNDLARLKTEFLGTISHELRTPLTAIVGFAHILDSGLNDLDADDVRDYVRRINRNASSLASLLQQVLDFSRLEREQLRVTLREVDLAEVVARVVESVSPMCEEHRVEVSAPPSLVTWSDPEALERVVANLLINAVKFSPSGSTVRVSVAPSERGAVLMVDDEGPGIAPEERERIFERFYRGGSEAALRSRGAGIGLAVVRELLDAVGASIEVTDSPTGGARFVVLVGAVRGTPFPVHAGAAIVQGGRHEVAT